MNAYDILKERGFIAQVTYEDDLRKAFDEGMVTFYTGFDPTADSLHIGHYIPIMAMAHLQRAGHKPIALMGGGTGMIGDPSGKSDLRKVLTVADIDHNVECFKKQMSRFLDFDPAKENCAVIANNAEWLRSLKYIDFLRDVDTCRVCALLRDTKDGSKASLRCEDGYDVAAVAARFGGGGHKNAAGCSFDVPAEEAEAVLRKALCTIVSEKQNA